MLSSKFEEANLFLISKSKIPIMKNEVIYCGKTISSINPQRNRFTSIASLIIHCYLGRNEEECFLRIQISLWIVVNFESYTIFQLFPLFTLCCAQQHTPRQIGKRNFNISGGDNYEKSPTQPKTRKFFHRYYLISHSAA